MKKTISYYNLKQILEAAKTFAKTKDAAVMLEENLRKTESSKTNIPEKDIIEISYETFCEVMSQLTVCYESVIIAVLSKFQMLGYVAIEKTVPPYPSLN